MALDVHINIKAFLLESHDFEAMAHLFDLYNGLVDPIGAVKFAIYVTQTLIGDGFMVRQPSCFEDYECHSKTHITDIPRIRCVEPLVVCHHHS